MKNAQRGMTLIGFLIVLAVAGVFAYVGMKLVPIYIEFHSVRSAMKAMSTEAGVASYSPEKVRDMFDRKLYINYSGDNLKPQNIKLTRQAAAWKMDVKYEVRKPLIANLDIVARFDRSEILGRQGGID